MKNTSSRSVKAIPKAEPEQATNGTPPIDLPSEPISTESTRWTILGSNRKVIDVTVKGGRGRISFSAARNGGGEVRIYRNESTKAFDAVFKDVESIWSDRVDVNIITEPQTTGWGEAKEMVAEKLAVPWSTPSSEPMVPWADLTPAEQAEYINRAGDASGARELYEREESERGF